MTALKAYFSNLPLLGLRVAAVFAVFAMGALVFGLVIGRQRRAQTGDAELLGWAFPRRLFTHPSSRPERLQFVLYHLALLPLFQAVLIATFSVISAGIVFSLLAKSFGLGAALIAGHRWIVVFQLASFFLAAEFAYYWAHRWCHTVPLLWAFHRVHHSAEALTPLSQPRGSPIDLVVIGFLRTIASGVISGVILFAAQTPPERTAQIAYAVLGAFLPYGLDAWRHSHVRLSFGPFDRIFSTPAVHQLHHSAEERHRDRNFGAELVLFDWLFGTLILPVKGEAYRWGLNENELGENNPHLRLRDFYLEPFAYLAKRWIKRGG